MRKLSLSHRQTENSTEPAELSYYCVASHNLMCALGLGDMAKKIITIIFVISVDIDNYHDKCQIFISFKFKARILLHLLIFHNKINI